MMRVIAGLSLALVLALASGAKAEAVFIFHLVDPNNAGAEIGRVEVLEVHGSGTRGILFKSFLDGTELGLGFHGFHVRENPNCEVAPPDGGDSTATALGAGGHFHVSPETHLGPYNPAGHLGDLPNLYVEQIGGEVRSTSQVYAPRLKLADLEERSLVITKDQDLYQEGQDGGVPIACAVLLQQ